MTQARHYPEALHGLRGYISSLENGPGATGLVADRWMDGAYDRLDRALGHHERTVAELERAEARVRELEDALRQIADQEPDVCWTTWMIDVARAALGSSPSREETPGENTP